MNEKHHCICGSCGQPMRGGSRGDQSAECEKLRARVKELEKALERGIEVVSADDHGEQIPKVIECGLCKWLRIARAVLKGENL